VVLVDRALEVLLAEDHGPPADTRRRPPLPLFNDLETDAFVDLIERTSLRELSDGQAVVKQGDPGSSVFIIISGQAQVLAETDPPRQLAMLGGGALFGELSVLTGAPRSASIYAVGDVELFEISLDDLDYVSKSYPSVPKALAEFAQRRLAMNLLATAPLFTQLASDQRGPVLQRFRGRIVPANERVINEGEPSAGLFLVLSGEFAVIKKNDAGERVTVKVLGDGEVFGEISLLSGGPASASVTAVRKSATAFLPRAAYDELVQSYPQVEEFLVKLSQKRLSANAMVVQPAEVMDAESLIEAG
jgi:CRP-like cAMP-binding protein